MADPIPVTDNRLAYWVGLVFHPAVICVPTLFLVLNDYPPLEMVTWTGLTAAIVTFPGLITILLMEKRQRYIYRRENRLPVYLIIWLSIVTGLAVLHWKNGPTPLFICMATLLVWLPVQLLINSYFTKVSTHVAVAAGCVTGLMILGKLDTLLLQIIAMGIVLLLIWARIKTQNPQPHDTTGIVRFDCRGWVSADRVSTVTQVVFDCPLRLARRIHSMIARTFRWPLGDKLIAAISISLTKGKTHFRRCKNRYSRH